MTRSRLLTDYILLKCLSPPPDNLVSPSYGPSAVCQTKHSVLTLQSSIRLSRGHAVETVPENEDAMILLGLWINCLNLSAST